MNVNDREMSNALGWCMVLALFHIAYCYSAWLRLQNLMVLFWKAKDFPELGGEYGGQGG